MHVIRDFEVTFEILTILNFVAITFENIKLLEKSSKNLLCTRSTAVFVEWYVCDQLTFNKYTKLTRAKLKQDATRVENYVSEDNRSPHVYSNGTYVLKNITLQNQAHYICFGLKVDRAIFIEVNGKV